MRNYFSCFTHKLRQRVHAVLESFVHSDRRSDHSPARALAQVGAATCGTSAWESRDSISSDPGVDM